MTSTERRVAGWLEGGQSVGLGFKKKPKIFP
jgi:hypothetical protein